MRRAILFLFLALVPQTTTLAEPNKVNGFRIHLLDSPFQAKKTTLRVLLPDTLEEGKECRVLFVLPVHEDGVFKHGHGMLELKKADIHNKHDLICVAPAFTSQPWYADHDQNPAKRDESHLLKTVIPFVESCYPVRTDGEGRLLIGFSKSGWGAMTLLLRHPDMFHKAVGWDPGVRMDIGQFETEGEREQRIRRDFGSDQNFEKYRLSRLLKREGKPLGDKPRLFYFNCPGNKRTKAGADLHAIMIKAGFPHRYVLDVERKHRWDSGWISEAVAFLVDTD